MIARYLVIMPVQELSRAMPRSGLTEDQRARLSFAFATDTLHAIRECISVTDIALVSPDASVADLAARNGAQFVKTPSQTGLNEAVDQAHRDAVEGSDRMVAAIVSDLPALAHDELDEVLEKAWRRRDAVFVPDLAGLGVTLQTSREATFQARLAPEPMHQRRREGALVGSTAAGLRCDVDTCWGIRIATLLGVGTATRQALEELGELGDLPLGQAEPYAAP